MREKQSSGHRWLASLVIALGLPMAGGTLHAASDAGEARAKSKITNKAYIVQLAEQPVSAYTGGIRGYGATRPNKGQKIDPNAPKVVSYMSYLASRHDARLLRNARGLAVWTRRGAPGVCQHVERHFAPQGAINRPIHCPHPSTSDLAQTS